jgi:predicted AlkP superfamily phosphohydrolase/phosphomutase
MVVMAPLSARAADLVVWWEKGNHRPNAFSLAVGPGIASGATLEGVHILDLAPTLLAHLGIEVPAYMTGRVLHELWRPTSAAAD